MRTRSPVKADWTRSAKEQTLAAARRLLAEAKRNTQGASGELAFLVRLADEIVQARAEELTRTYRGLVLLMPGFRKKGLRHRHVQEPCVVLVVRKKHRDMPKEHPQRLPGWLVTFAEREGRRMPFAIPTDVQDADQYYAAVPHSESGVWVPSLTGGPEAGALTCLARLAHDGGESLCVLGAMHVFSPEPDGRSLQVAGGVDVMPLDAQGQAQLAPTLAVTSEFGGILRSDEDPDRPSLDVQVAEVDADGQAQVRERIALRKFNGAQPFTNTRDEMLALGTQFTLLLPDNLPGVESRGEIAIGLGAMPKHLPFPIPYTFADGTSRKVFHAELLRFDAQGASQAPMPGDSGSPIVFKHPDGSMTLVAMHIAGDGFGASWAVPAWRFADPTKWWQFPPGARLIPEDA